MAVLRERDHAAIQPLSPTAHTLSKSQLTQPKRSPHCTEMSLNVHSGISFEVVVSHYYLENNFLFQLSNHITPKDKDNMLSLKKHLSRNLSLLSSLLSVCYQPSPLSTPAYTSYMVNSVMATSLGRTHCQGGHRNEWELSDCVGELPLGEQRD